MAQGKWIDGLRPDTPLADAARRVLTVRLEVVRDHLPLAVEQADEDPEHVHQLRVGTRRAGAALDIFAGCLPDKALKSARKKVRRLRRAAGAARDWDVFLLDLAEWKDGRPTKHRPGLDFLTGYGHAQRATAQDALRQAVALHPFALDRVSAHTVAAVRRPDHGPATLGELARPTLASLLRDLESAAHGDLDDYAHLHQVRIAGKRLRYAMEVFADCFAPAFRDELYPQVEDMQEILGRANDSHVAEGRLQAIEDHLRRTNPADLKRYSPGLNGLLKHHRKRLPEEREHFLQWWGRWHGSGAETELTRLLLRPDPVSLGA